MCGSDLHLLHGTVVQLEKGDILGHEFCGIVDDVGSAVTKVKKGDRVVASFQIACGDVCCAPSLDYHKHNKADRMIVLLLQAEALISMREDQRQHNRERHVRWSHRRYVRIQPFHWRIRWWSGRVHSRSIRRCQPPQDPRRCPR